MSRLTKPFLRSSRWRPWLVLFGIGIAWKIVVLTLGAAVPRWVVGDGIEHLPLNLQPYAIAAQATARPRWDLPIERLGVIRAQRVVRVDTLRATTAADSLAGASCGNLQATVRAYTYFAIPYGEVRTLCASGEVQYRLFRRRRR